MRIGGASRLAKTALVLLCAQEAAAWVGPLGKGRLASTRGRADSQRSKPIVAESSAGGKSTSESSSSSSFGFLQFVDDVKRSFVDWSKELQEATDNAINMQLPTSISPDKEAMIEQAISAVTQGGAETEAKYLQVVTALEGMREQQAAYLAEREREVALMQEYSEAIKQLNVKVYKLESELQTTRKALKEVQNIRRDLAYRLEQAQVTLKSVRESSSKALEALQSQLMEERTNAQAIRQREAALVAEKERAQAEIGLLITEMMQNTQVEEQRVALEARLASLGEGIAKQSLIIGDMAGASAVKDDGELWGDWFGRTFGEMESRVATMERALAEYPVFKSEAVEFKDKTAQLSQQLAMTQTQLAEARTELEGWRSRAEGDSSARESVEGKMEQMKTLYDSETNRLRASLQRTEQQLEAVQAHVNTIKQEVEDRMSARMAEMQDSHASELAILHQQRQAQAQSYEESLAAKVLAITDLESSVLKEQKAMKALQSQVDDLQSRVKSEVSRREREVARLQSQMDREREDARAKIKHSEALAQMEATNAQAARDHLAISAHKFSVELRRVHQERQSVRGAAVALLKAAIRRVARALRFRKRSAAAAIEADVQRSLERAGLEEGEVALAITQG